VSNSFFFNETGFVRQLTLWLWAFPGDTITGFDWDIAFSPQGTQIVSGRANATELVVTFLESNQYGYWIFEVQAVLPQLKDIPFFAGETYWLEIQNAVVPNGDSIYWDQSDNPINQAWESELGYLDSDGQGPESFLISGQTI